MDTIMEEMDAFAPGNLEGGGTNVQTLRKHLGGPSGRRLNSTGTMQVDDTVSCPNNELTIVAVAERLHGYIYESTFGSTDDPNRSPTKEVTKKLKSTKISSPSPTRSENHPPQPEGQKTPTGDDFPTVERIARYLREIFRTAQCSVDCTIVCLIYIERLMQTSGLKLTTKNWRSLIAIGMLLASKVHDDLSMVNADFACFLPFSVEQINAWERQFLAGIKYDVRVSAAHYTKYYFDLREQAKKHFIGNGQDLGVLDLTKAQKLELLSNKVQKRFDELGHQSKNMTGNSKLRRAVSDQYCSSHQQLVGEVGLPEAPAFNGHVLVGTYATE